MRIAWGIARLVAALVGIAALVARFEYGLGFGSFATENFFWYFTIQTAFSAVALWGVGGTLALLRPSDPRWLTSSRLLVTCYQIISGVVYGTIVAGAAATDYRFEVPVSDRILHYWLPAFAILDWVLAPGRGRISWKRLSVALVFPMLWGAATVWRGASVGWYPYFFFDPDQVGGWWGIAAYLAVMGVVITALTAVLIAVSHLLPRPLRDADARDMRAARSEPGASRGASVVDGGYRDEAVPVTANGRRRGSLWPPEERRHRLPWKVAWPDPRR
ncbi:Pr6Pr family membrane protein [Homoserinimonas sp. OAct 916]|uniref:Pr6Pr family membrane protein n=1 Tax=Homoserinimonas sp. OAct 916 TaxID=2211450 RepID=UPI0013002DD2|nr:Pr6Pr family membrane protein [Homoserinimonas sp. OAct 916]